MLILRTGQAWGGDAHALSPHQSEEVMKNLPLGCSTPGRLGELMHDSKRKRSSFLIVDSANKSMADTRADLDALHISQREEFLRQIKGT